MQAPVWRYVGEADPERLAALMHPPRHGEFTRALQLGLQLKCFHREARGDDATYVRAVFCGSVSLHLFDWFFNSSTGYRGAFFESPENGSRANRLLVGQLAHSLADWAVAEQRDPDREWVLASLAKPSAKAWLAEHPGLCAECEGEWSSSYVSELQIENSRWECSSHTHSVWGRQVPRMSKIRVFGGFINAEQHEWVAPHKTARATHIWEHGWS